jgi:hypothetical protein
MTKDMAPPQRLGEMPGLDTWQKMGKTGNLSPVRFCTNLLGEKAHCTNRPALHSPPVVYPPQQKAPEATAYVPTLASDKLWHAPCSKMDPSEGRK